MCFFLFKELRVVSNKGDNGHDDKDCIKGAPKQNHFEEPLGHLRLFP